MKKISPVSSIPLQLFIDFLAIILLISLTNSVIGWEVKSRKTALQHINQELGLVNSVYGELETFLGTMDKAGTEQGPGWEDRQKRLALKLAQLLNIRSADAHSPDDSQPTNGYEVELQSAVELFAGGTPVISDDDQATGYLQIGNVLSALNVHLKVLDQTSADFHGRITFLAILRILLFTAGLILAVSRGLWAWRGLRTVPRAGQKDQTGSAPRDDPADDLIEEIPLGQGSVAVKKNSRKRGQTPQNQPRGVNPSRFQQRLTQVR